MFTVKFTINHLIGATSNGKAIDPTRYVTDLQADGSHFARHISYAKTWKTRKGAQRWIDERRYNENNKHAIAEVVEI